ncbi:MAG TPA: class I SAM-dependent methyltransferase [Pirellulaceae bacterium]|jgi:S-adenosylmethionine-diacylgycerolhomoserine-N-methlytransferase
MSLASDLKILYHLALKPVRGKDHAARMESFYSGQAGAYDDFRKRLLKGRQELWSLIPPPPGGTWIDMGGGTGANLDYFLTSKTPNPEPRASCPEPLSPPHLAGLEKIYVLDLSHSLLEIAKQRIASSGWTNVETVEADATTFQPPTGPVDVVTFSYSLTMIPDWFAAIENALTILKPGGTIGIVDFYVSRKYASGALARHGWGTRTFWPTWFALDNVFPSPDHVPFLHRHFDVLHFEEHRSKVPYIPLARVPYYMFIGRKRGS